MPNLDYVFIHPKKKVYSMWPLCFALGSAKHVKEIIIFMEIEGSVSQWVG